MLDWALMFDDDESVIGFLDHARERFAAFPDAKQPVDAERYMKYPSVKLPDVADTRQILPAARQHPPGASCPATPLLPPGTLDVKVFGRALDKAGQPVADSIRQEHYVEDRFEVPPALQAKLARTFAVAGADRFRIPDDLAKLIVSHAFLGQLDVNPVAAPGGSGGQFTACEFWGKRAGDGSENRIHIEGRSQIVGGEEGPRGRQMDGRTWHHEVKLAWEGLIELQAGRVQSLLLVARGSEELRWGNQLGQLEGGLDVTHLPAGHPIDLKCGVRYGIVGEPVAPDRAAPADAAQTAGRLAPAENDRGAPGRDPGRDPFPGGPPQVERQISEVLGLPFLIFQPDVQDELKVSAEQKQKLNDRLSAQVRDTMQFFDRTGRLNPDERDLLLQRYRQKALESLVAFLNDELQSQQLLRFRQVMFQREGPNALHNPDMARELKFTDEQRRQLADVLQNFQKRVQPLLQEAQSKGNANEIGPRIMQFREEQNRQIEAILTADQAKRWKEMMGRPFGGNEE